MNSLSPRSLVTGGCGFIGSHLVDLLLEQGHEVVVLDNMSTGRRANLEHLPAGSAVRIVEGSVQDLQVVEGAMAGCDYVFHLASLADIVPSIVNPLGYFSANVDGTVVVVDAARRLGVKKLVYTASSSCYGIPDIVPTPESADIRPQYPYAFTKWAGSRPHSTGIRYTVYRWFPSGSSTCMGRAPAHPAPTGLSSGSSLPRSLPVSR